jgi:glycosyltransferase involved in cell wall biosynthesis
VKTDVTVVVPVWNAQNWIKASIMSTLQSLDQMDQIIVINDASEDRTLEILQKIKDPRLFIFTNSINLGVAECLNIGIQNTQTKYLARMDADDICFPWRFDFQKSRIKKTEIIFGNGVYINSLNNIQGLHNRNPRKNSINLKTKFLQGNPLLHPTMFARTDLLRTFQYKHSIAEDYELWMRMLINGVELEETFVPLIRYRKHPAQISKKLKKSNYLKDETLRNTFKEYNKKFGDVTFSEDQYLAACGVKETYE